MKVLIFAVALRKGSFNKKLAHMAYRFLLEQNTHQPELVEFNEFPMPMYDGDIETEKGIPDGVQRLAKKISQADAIIISSPEYNHSIPGTFKNAIDWLSRMKPVSLEGKQILLMGASIGPYAGVRGQMQARIPLTALKAHIHPEYFGLAKAETAFDEQGKLKDAKQVEFMQKTINSFLKIADRHTTPFEHLDQFIEEKLHTPQ